MSLRGEIVWDTSEFRRFIAQALPRAVEASALMALDKAGDDSLRRVRDEQAAAQALSPPRPEDGCREGPSLLCTGSEWEAEIG